MQKRKMSVIEFNYHFSRIRDDKSLAKLYGYCLEVIKQYMYSHYRMSDFYQNVPHDVFTRVMIEYPPKGYIASPVAFLCKATRNYMNDMFNSKDNNTLELKDNYPYIPQFDNNIEFSDRIIEEKWHKLDAVARYILYLNILLKYKLKEIGELLDMDYANVRTIKSRAIKKLAKECKEAKKENNEVKKEDNKE